MLALGVGMTRLSEQVQLLVEFLRGPLVFYEETRKTLSRWKYQPTLLNGEPVEILTQIDVNYTLSR